MSDPVLREQSGSRLVLAAGVLGLGILLGAVAFGIFFHAARSRTDTIQVVGSASERFQSDIAKWRVVLARQVGQNELTAGYALIRSDVARFVAALRAAGIDSSSIGIQPVNAQPVWGPEGRRERYNLVQGLYVVSDVPERLEALALDPGRLLGEGVVLESSQLEFYYSKIAQMKRSLLSKATEDARLRAQEIAGAAGGGIGRMLSARAGVFQITEPYSTEVAAYGIHSTSTKEKEISVTVHATFSGD